MMCKVLFAGLIYATLLFPCFMMHSSEQQPLAEHSVSAAKAALLAKVSYACNRACGRCAPTEAIFREAIHNQGIPLLQTLVPLIMAYVKHFKEMPLRQENRIKYDVDRPLPVLFWEREIGPSINSIKRVIKAPAGSHLEVYLKKRGGDYYPKITPTTRLNAQFVWYYRLVFVVAPQRLVRSLSVGEFGKLINKHDSNAEDWG